VGEIRTKPELIIGQIFGFQTTLSVYEIIYLKIYSKEDFACCFKTLHAIYSEF